MRILITSMLAVLALIGIRMSKDKDKEDRKKVEKVKVGEKIIAVIQHKDGSKTVKE